MCGLPFSKFFVGTYCTDALVCSKISVFRTNKLLFFYHRNITAPCSYQGSGKEEKRIQEKLEKGGI